MPQILYSWIRCATALRQYSGCVYIHISRDYIWVLQKLSSTWSIRPKAGEVPDPKHWVCILILIYKKGPLTYNIVTLHAPHTYKNLPLVLVTITKVTLMLHELISRDLKTDRKQSHPIFEPPAVEQDPLQLQSPMWDFFDKIHCSTWEAFEHDSRTCREKYP
jgi:hypothetical protein